MWKIRGHRGLISLLHLITDSNDFRKQGKVSREVDREWRGLQRAGEGTSYGPAFTSRHADASLLAKPIKAASFRPRVFGP